MSEHVEDYTTSCDLLSKDQKNYLKVALANVRGHVTIHKFQDSWYLTTQGYVIEKPKSSFLLTGLGYKVAKTCMQQDLDAVGGQEFGFYLVFNVVLTGKPFRIPLEIRATNFARALQLGFTEARSLYPTATSIDFLEQLNVNAPLAFSVSIAGGTVFSTPFANTGGTPFSSTLG